ncbi:MAG: glycoside hydrolase family 2 TIM barrel-domain containing protein [Ferruginibacter sp.]
MKNNIEIYAQKKAACMIVFLLSSCIAFSQMDLPPAPISSGEKLLQDHQFGDSIFSREFGRIISLNGQWDIAEGQLNKPPKKYSNKIIVPGLVNAKETSFKDIGKESGLREAFWYRKKFSIDGVIPEVARLKIFKAMFGTKVYLNGKEVGENPLNFTPGYFNLKPFLKGNNQPNEIVVRVGAFISQVPDTVLSGGEAERHRYPPGIYDRVEIILSGSPYILRTQVVPDIILQQARIIIDVANTSRPIQRLSLQANIFEYKTGKQVATGKIEINSIASSNNQTADITIPIPGCKWWSPEDPNLYVLQLTDNRYSYFTRFGMRSFKVDTAFTNRVLLNGSPYYIRGTNFAIHRFFEDPLCWQQPWDKAWVRKLFSVYTAMGMNGVRFSISAAPEIWFDIADEEGMIVFDEFPIWSAFQPEVGDVSSQANNPVKKWGIVKTRIKAHHIVNEFTHWMQERWNHASVLVWDAQNETWSPETGKAIREVRKLDFSNRPWDNGWSPPVDATDIREAHPYFESYTKGTEQMNDRKKVILPFTLSDVPNNAKVPSTFYLPYQYTYKELPLNSYWQQAVVLNEYSYLWLNRDGTPTTLTKDYYEAVLGAGATADQRRELYAKYLAAVTGYWRSLRTCFAVLYPFGINYSMPGGETSDNLADVDSVSFDKYFMKYVPDAFAPLSISIDYWDTRVELNESNPTAIDVPLFITNDINSPQTNYVKLKLMQGDTEIKQIQTRYEVAAVQQCRIILRMDMPGKPGNYQLVAEMETGKSAPVRSYRSIELFKK